MTASSHHTTELQLRPLLTGSLVQRLTPSQGRLLAVIPKGARREVIHAADVELGKTAPQGFRVRDRDSGLSIDVSLEGAPDAPARLEQGYVLYDAPDRSILHRIDAEGTEDFVLYRHAPSAALARYRVRLGSGVAGVRLVANVLEFLDAEGAPRLRMRPPFVADKNGTRHVASVSVAGCDVSTNPRVPWNQPVLSPGAKACRVSISWQGAPVPYPAVLDPGWVATGSMTVPRIGMTVHPIYNYSKTGVDRVLVGGGDSSETSTEMYDAATKTWAATGSWTVARNGPSGTVIANPVTNLSVPIVAGGLAQFSSTTSLASAETYDLNTGVWTATANSMSVPRQYHAMATGNYRMKTGTTSAIVPAVYACGGQYRNSSNQLIRLSSCDVYFDAAPPDGLSAARSWRPGPTLLQPRLAFTMSSINNSVFAAGGYNTADIAQTERMLWEGICNTSPYIANQPMNQCIYANAGVACSSDADCKRWAAAGNLNVPRDHHVQLTLPSNVSVIVIGGRASNGNATATAEYWDRLSNTWTETVNPMRQARMYPAAVVNPINALGMGVLAVAGNTMTGFGDETAGTEFLNLVQGSTSENRWYTLPSLKQARSDPGAVALTATGITPSVIVFGGSYGGGATAALASAELWSGAVNGGPCTSGDSRCISTYCTDGVCCDSACTGTCKSCAAATNVAGDDGTCGDAKSGTDPHNDCAVVGSGTCQTSGLCNGSGACQTQAGVVCAAATCTSQTTLQSAYRCDATGSCTPQGSTDCSPYQCSGSACKTSCTSNSDCATGFLCDTSKGTCGKGNNGDPCTSANQCASGFCADNVCCDSACTGACQSCVQVKKASGPDGLCGPTAAGVADSKCTTSPPCGPDGKCNGQGACRAYAPAPTPCGANVCQSGAASGFQCDGSGNCVQQTGTPCTPYVCGSSACLTTCTSDAQCVSDHYCDVATGSCLAKQADGQTCTADDQCTSGACADGYCCDTKCTELCNSCDGAFNTAGNGKCSPVQADQDPRNDCDPDPNNLCGTTGLCDGTGHCARAKAGTQCGANSCSLDSLVTKACDGFGNCASNSSACAPYGCDSTTHDCRTSCQSNADCSQGALCDTVTGKCAVGTQTCKDSMTVLLPNGESQSCSPYRCVGGTCKDTCTTNIDCAPGYACQSSSCVPLLDGGTEGGSATKAAAGNNSGGCGCSLPGGRRPSRPWFLLSLIGVAFGLRRGRRERTTRAARAPRA